MYPIYSVNLADQPPNITNAKSRILLNVDFSNAVSGPTGSNERTICYVVVVSRCALLYEPSKNKITEIN